MALREWLESKWILRWVRSGGKAIFYIIGGAIGIGALIWYTSTKSLGGTTVEFITTLHT